jgi:2-aminoadipate transaminase
MIEAFERELGDVDGVSFTRPEGGMFLWLKMPECVDSGKLFEKTIEKNVAFVVGAAFDCYGERNNTARINFSFPTVEQIHEGVKILGDCVKEMVGVSKVTA